MKILFIDQYNTIGGGQTILTQLINIALEQNFKVSLLIPPGGEIKPYISPKVNVIPLSGLNIGQKKGPLDYFKLLLATFSFFKYYKEFKNHDLIYVNGPRCFIPAAITSLFSEKKVIYHIHLHHNELEKKIIHYISKLNNTFKVVVNSEFIYKDIQPLIKTTKLHLLENTLSQKFNILNFINRFNNSEKLNFAIIGRVSDEKGQHIIPDIARQFPNHNFYIIGDRDFASPQYFENLKKKAPLNMIFYGKSSNIIDTINVLSIHISLLTSTVEESFGLVAIESMACSCLTIVSERGELLNIAEKTNALTFKTSEDLTKKIKQLTETPSENLSALANKQFSLTKKYYNFDKFRTNFIQLINLI